MKSGPVLIATALLLNALGVNSYIKQEVSFVQKSKTNLRRDVTQNDAKSLSRLAAAKSLISVTKSNSSY